jgi:hypothetical protein
MYLAIGNHNIIANVVSWNLDAANTGRILWITQVFHANLMQSPSKSSSRDYWQRRCK